MWQTGDSATLAEGFTLISVSISGAFTGDLNPGGAVTYLAYKQSENTNIEMIHGTTLIDDIYVLPWQNKGDELFQNFVIIDKNLNKGFKGEKLNLAYHERSPLGLCDMRYQYSTIDRYPVQVYDH